MEKEILKIGGTTHYDNGVYRLEVKDKDGNIVCGITGSIYEYMDIVSAQFNQLKGKLYNLVESSVIDEKQREAMKGLIKDFCNDKYKNVIIDMEDWLKRMGFDICDHIQGSSPLDTPE